MEREGYHLQSQNNTGQFTGTNINQVGNQLHNSYPSIQDTNNYTNTINTNIPANNNNNNNNSNNNNNNNNNNMELAIDRSNILKSYNAGVLRPNDNMSYQGGISHIAVPTQPSYMSGFSPRVADPYAHAYYPYMYGHDKWPYRVESAFTSALRLIIKNGTSKIKIRNKNYGRNELISIYIKYHTGEVRTKKQISSHIQVWKKSILNKLSTNVRLTSLDQEILELIEKGPIQNEETLKLFYSVFDEIIDACSKDDIDSTPNVVATMNAIPKEQYYENKPSDSSFSESNENIRTPKHQSTSPQVEQKSSGKVSKSQNRLPLQTSLSSGSTGGYEFSKPMLVSLNDFKHGSSGMDNVNYQRTLQDSHILKQSSATPSTAPMSALSSTPTDITGSSALSSKWALHTQRSDRDFIDVYDSHLPSSRDLRKGAEPMVAATIREDLGRGAMYGQNDVRAVEQPVYSIVLPQPVYQHGTPNITGIHPNTAQNMNNPRTQAPLPAGYVNNTMQSDNIYQPGTLDAINHNRQHSQAGIGLNNTQMAGPLQAAKVGNSQYIPQGYQYGENKNVSLPPRDVTYVPGQFASQIQQQPAMGVVYQQPIYATGSNNYENPQSNPLIPHQGLRSYNGLVNHDNQGIYGSQGSSNSNKYAPNYIISGSTFGVNNNVKSNSSSPRAP
ncbi:Ty transcription activator TEC1 [Nakaseomyces bracarensis]|uniref:Ty transcription activator TEC1 n=1 Tax=Nakaseomyces bracarensis TaxID=273131 RepID=A0ABR4NYS0_9SACH